MQVCLVARYWTKLFVLFVLLSYWLVYPFELIFPLVEQLFKVADSAQYGVAKNVFATPTFWFVCLLANMTTFGHRYIERAGVWLFKPNDDMILVEIESQEVRFRPSPLSLACACTATPVSQAISARQCHAVCLCWLLSSPSVLLARHRRAGMSSLSHARLQLC